MLCLIDLSKFVDVINHELLITKLKMHGIETSWFADYLQGHTQSVSLYDRSRRKVLSRPLPNTMGVVQARRLVPCCSQYFPTTCHFTLETPSPSSTPMTLRYW